MVKLPPPLWTAIFLAIAAALSAAADWPRPPGLPIVWLGAALVAIGVAFSAAAALLFRREGTELNPISSANRKLVTSGPFQYTRNPMYLSLVVISLGAAIWIGAWPMFLAPLATFATANWVHIPFEEAKMRRQFGETYDAYARKVRRWL
ncbi:MAG TPA: isoprenylcysteine carboxylmethyltransferase family protein [Roseiarcus sp.]|nr:isoprenylcysteine carboxylmethyltransferase family protein [Roseiarcus sp.]